MMSGMGCFDTSARNPGKRGTLVHRDVISFVTLDLVLRLLLTCVNRVAFELNLGSDHFGDRAAYVARLRIPANVIATLEMFFRHRPCLHFELTLS